jgi:hypothetical protein
LTKSNEEFEKLLLKVTSSNPETILYDFKDLTSFGLTIATSDDSLFRIYSWDTRSGGTMHYFENVFQFRNGKNTVSKKIFKNREEDRPDPGCFYYQINDISVGDKKFYIAQGESILSTALFYYKIKTFSISGSKLMDDDRFIKTKSGYRSELGYAVDLSRVGSKDQDDNDSGYSIVYDKDNKKIILPLILENGKISGKKIVYQFTGKCFEKL